MAFQGEMNWDSDGEDDIGHEDAIRSRNSSSRESLPAQSPNSIPHFQTGHPEQDASDIWVDETASGDARQSLQRDTSSEDRARYPGVQTSLEENAGSLRYVVVDI